MSDSLFDIDMSEIESFQFALANEERLENAFMLITRACAKRLHDFLRQETPVDAGYLRAGWNADGNLAVKVIPVKGGYEVHFTNSVPYADWVNRGHVQRMVANGPPVRIHHRKVAYFDGIAGPYYVFGVFFVEKAIIKLEDGTKVLENIFSNLIDQWWDWCLS